MKKYKNTLKYIKNKNTFQNINIYIEIHFKNKKHIKIHFKYKNIYINTFLK